MSIDLIKSILTFLGGLGMFIYGMEVMAEGLQNSAGSKTKKLLGMLTNNRLMGVLLGTLVTAIIQSSSATTVMVVGFVNAGLMNLSQAIGVIMGANIGTTMTAWIVSIGEWGSLLKPDFFAPILLVIGVALILFSTKQHTKDKGNIFVGFGILFIGLSTMSGSISPYADSPVFSNAFATIGRNPILGLLVGLVVTAIIQSSSASMGILQTLALNGIVNWGSAVFIALGQNIGTCVTALLSSVGASRNARRAAIMHLLFNVIGAVVAGIVCWIYFIKVPDMAMAKVSSTSLAIFHSSFNIITTIYLYPFADKIVALSQKIIPETEEEKAQKEGLVHLDNRMLQTPGFALAAVKQEINKMGEVALENISYSRDTLLTNEHFDELYANEKKINEYEKELSDFLSNLNATTLSEKEQLQLQHSLLAISDIERIGDHCREIADMMKEDNNVEFSDAAKQDIQTISTQAYKTLKWAMDIRTTKDLTKIANVEKHENKVDVMEKEMREGHIQRLIDGRCSVEAGITFLDSIMNYERMSDHAEQIAQFVVEEEKL
ncbi:Na/Pi cotransporter family protein [Catenisphaera adipataccumulans]|jgi:phosphate:Na+ symporter|uniref:Phosphate:Na+ symporter n=1 Tax=Catenisphaera adipataccumulans TaxID=700500 RepID=A0A7W8CYW7_9FIRM|nr:Na/Pi cotransporter family protein [Catenisphaera adipataccumulans]MBB5182510.1 phosphate:Na+ symporter [Catenisphaera adipataccumulans]